MSTPKSLKELVKRSYVLSYREDVQQLEDALLKEGLTPIVLRQQPSQCELTYARATRCFLNHRHAWELAANSDGYTLICESDFVPCVGIGEFESFWPLDDELAWGYLYQGSPRLLALIGKPPFLRGHCAPTVAYLVSPQVAAVFCDFFEYESSRYEPTNYYTFEAHLQWWTMGRGARAFIPLKHYGEHGGLPNPEHEGYGHSRAGTHRADNLAAPLYFLPPYSKGSWLRYFSTRLASRALGFARLFTGRWIVTTNVYTLDWMAKLRMFLIGLRRLA